MLRDTNLKADETMLKIGIKLDFLGYIWTTKGNWIKRFQSRKFDSNETDSQNLKEVEQEAKNSLQNINLQLCGQFHKLEVMDCMM